MYAALVIAKAAPSGDPPTVTLDTADAHEFSTATPTLQFTGADTDADDLEFQIEIADNTDFATGTVLLDSYTGGGTGSPIHPGPIGSLDWRGEQQVDDRPMQSADTDGGGILDSVDFKIGNDQSFVIGGDTLARIYTHSGTFGTSSAPAGAAAQASTPTPGWLAESDAVNWDDSEPGTPAWYQHDFSSTDRIQLPPATKVMVAADWLATSGDNANTVAFQADGTGGTHGGNVYIDGDSANYGLVRAAYDLQFRLRAVQTVYVSAVSETDAGFANQTNGGDSHPFTESDQHATGLTTGACVRPMPMVTGIGVRRGRS
jgi:hypothetical protein